MNRNRLPRWVNWIIDWIADHPTGVIGRIAARRYGNPSLEAFVSATSFDNREVRVLVAPVNYSGQGRAWAQALDDADRTISARNMAIDVPGGFSFEADLVVPVSTYHNDRVWQHRQLEAASTATHVLIEAEEPPFGRLLGRSTHRQAQALIDAGVDVAYIAHGTDARLPSRHVADNPWSYYRDPAIYRPRAETLAARNIGLLNNSGRPLFVSTPDLLVDLPRASWCPVVVDPDRWHCGSRSERSARAPLRVAHAPSVAVAKGTHLMMPTLQALAAEGVIELDLIQSVPSANMPARFAAADVVLDQFRAGSYGVAACEALAAGCLVVGQVTDQVRRTVLATSGRELPIVEANLETLESVLRAMAASRDLTPARRDGIDFVHEVHDGRLSATVLLDEWIRPTASTTAQERDDASRR